MTRSNGSDDWEQRALQIASRLSCAADELRELIAALRTDNYRQLGLGPDGAEGREHDARNES
jgi:hypothetical protein